MSDVRPFPAAIPIVGQPVVVLGWTLVVNARCQCDRPTVVQLVIAQSELGRNANLGMCPHCARQMHIAQVTMDAQGQLQFGLQLGASTPTPVGATS